MGRFSGSGPSSVRTISRSAPPRFPGPPAFSTRGARRVVLFRAGPCTLQRPCCHSGRARRRRHPRKPRGARPRR